MLVYVLFLRVMGNPRKICGISIDVQFFVSLLWCRLQRKERLRLKVCFLSFLIELKFLHTLLILIFSFFFFTAFRNQIQMDTNYAHNTWKLLKNAIHEIHRQNASGLSYEELYRLEFISFLVFYPRHFISRNAYNMVLHKYGDLLYEGLERVSLNIFDCFITFIFILTPLIQVVDKHLLEVAIEVTSTETEEEFLERMDSAWSHHKISMLMIRDILMYMVRLVFYLSWFD